MAPDHEIAAFRVQLAKIVASPEFSGSHRLVRFLSFVSEAAFTGRDHLDQSEIAERVLEHKEDFNPLDDASVRKLATLTRQKLEKYYAETGRDDPVVVTLPARCYVPSYSLRPKSNGPSRPPAPPGAPRGKRKKVVMGLAAVSILVAILMAHKPWIPHAAPRGLFEIQTLKGDVMHGLVGVAPNAIQLGPRIGRFEDVTTRLVFTADSANQQAGIMIFENQDRYVKLARSFNTRTQLEFGLETGGNYRKTPETFTSDTSGQNGAPIWLSIRRRDNTYRAFVGADGLSWRPLGGPLEMNDPMPNARLAIFAFNGLTNAPSTRAVFDHVSLGVNFHSGDGTSVADMTGWNSNNTCEPDGRIVAMADRIAFFLPSARRQCGWQFSRPVPPGDWTYVTQLDFLSRSGSYAGLRLLSKTGGIRLIRWTLNGGVITLERSQQVTLRDFPGSPPVFLRLDAANGQVTGSFSRDGEQFERLPVSVPLQDLGGDVRIGVCTGRSSWSGAEALPPAHFFYLRQELQTLQAYR